MEVYLRMCVITTGNVLFQKNVFSSNKAILKNISVFPNPTFGYG